MPKPLILSLSVLALLLAPAVVSGQTPTRLYLAELATDTSDAAHGRTAASTDVDYQSLARSILRVRLAQNPRVAVSLEQEPPCSADAAGAAKDVPKDSTGAESRTPAEASAAYSRYFRVRSDVRTRLKPGGGVLEVVLQYELFVINGCKAEQLEQKTQAFPPSDALSFLIEMVDTVAEAVRRNAVDPIPVEFVEPILITGGTPPQRATASTLRRAINFALVQDDNYPFELNSLVARTPKYKVQAEIQIVGPKGKAMLGISYRVTSEGREFRLPAEPAPFTSADSIYTVYFESAKSLVSLLKELQGREEAHLDDATEQINAGVLLRKARTLLCRETDKTHDCSPRPGTALTVLRQFSSTSKDTGESLELLGEAYFGVENFSDAAARFDRAEKITPESDAQTRIRLLRRAANAWFRADNKPFAADRYLEASSLFERFKDSLPLSSALDDTDRLNLARAFQSQKKYEQALGVLLEAYGSNPKSEDFISELGDLIDSMNGEPLEAALTRLNKSKLPPQILARAHTRLADWHQTRLEWAEEVRRRLDAYELQEKDPEPNNANLCLAANSLGLAQERNDDYENALKYHLIAERYGALVWPEGDQNRASLVANVARTYVTLGRSAEAAALLRPILDARRKALRSGNQSELLAYLKVVADAATELRDWPLGESAINEWISITKAEKTEKSHDYIYALNRLSSLYNDENKFEDAQNVLLRALPLAKEIKDPITPSIINNLGLFYYYRGQYSEAVGYYEQAAQLMESPTNLNNIGQSALLAADIRKADAARRKALKIATEHKDRTGMADAYYGLGDVLVEQGLYSEAEKAYRDSIAQFKTVAPVNQWRSSYALSGLGRLQTIRHEFDPATDNLNKALTLVKGRTYLSGLRLSEVGRLAYERGDFQESQELLKKAYDEVKKYAGETNPYALGVGAWLADAILGADNAEGAYNLHLEVYKQRKKYFPGPHPRVAESALGVAAALEKLSRSAEALPYAREALTMSKTLFDDKHPLAARAQRAVDLLTTKVASAP